MAHRLALLLAALVLAASAAIGATNAALDRFPDPVSRPTVSGAER